MSEMNKAISKDEFFGLLDLIATHCCIRPSSTLDSLTEAILSWMVANGIELRLQNMGSPDTQAPDTKEDPK